MIRRYLTILILAIICSQLTLANEEVKSEKEETVKEEKSFVIVPGPSYDPELKLGLTVMAMKLFKINESDKVSPPSSVTGVAMATTNSSWMGRVFARLYYKRDTWRSNFGFFRGNIQGELFIEETSRFEDHSSDVAAYFLNLHRKIYNNLYLGAGFTTSYLDYQSDAGFEKTTKNTSLNVELNYDTKDNQFSATSGGLGTIKLNIYREDLGNDFDFETIAFSYRKYLTIQENKNKVLALLFSSSFAIGPSNSNFNYHYGRAGYQRGYTGTVYEGKNMVRVEAEYRHYFESFLDARFGASVFTGVGTVYGGESKVGNPLPQNIKDADPLPHIGGGIRYKLIPEKNVMSRLDFGWGKEEEFTMYFSLRESI